MSSTLARFRADPKKVRVRLRWRERHQKWLVTISGQRGPKGQGTPTAWAWSDNPNKALLNALHVAREIPGIDLDMQHAYEHPFGRIT